jgi:uncharacterized RDD family membrane protein YckC
MSVWPRVAFGTTAGTGVRAVSLAGPIRRFQAMGLDLLVIAGWACFAGMVAAVLHLAGAVPVSAGGRDAVAFVTLVLPVTLTFARQEAAPRQQATWGKRHLRLIVTDVTGAHVSRARIVARNVVKFAPWQAAHTTVFHLQAGSTAGWLIVMSIGAQCVVLLSTLAMIVDRRHRSLHDLVAGTRVAVHHDGTPRV